MILVAPIVAAHALAVVSPTIVLQPEHWITTFGGGAGEKDVVGCMLMVV
jgi:hypothetical protein